jgi:hypothetical protein
MDLRCEGFKHSHTFAGKGELETGLMHEFGGRDPSGSPVVLPDVRITSIPTLIVERTFGLIQMSWMRGSRQTGGLYPLFPLGICLSLVSRQTVMLRSMNQQKTSFEVAAWPTRAVKHDISSSEATSHPTRQKNLRNDTRYLRGKNSETCESG